MTIRLASDLQSDSIVDGLGIRTVVWTQGCGHNCPGCHNPGTHDFKGGFLKDIEELKQEISELTHQAGVTFSGGDPFYQAKECALIAQYVKQLGMNVWCYTGFLFEELIEMSKKNDNIMKFLKEIDVLVDGPFVMEKRSYDSKFCGSTNQRVIDVSKSLENNDIIYADISSDNQLSNYGRSNTGLYI